MKYVVNSYSEIETELKRIDSEYYVGMSQINTTKLKGYTLSELCDKVVLTLFFRKMVSPVSMVKIFILEPPKLTCQITLAKMNMII
jgi:hypothetical protein